MKYNRQLLRTENITVSTIKLSTLSLERVCFLHRSIFYFPNINSLLLHFTAELMNCGTNLLTPYFPSYYWIVCSITSKFTIPEWIVDIIKSNPKLWARNSLALELWVLRSHWFAQYHYVNDYCTNIEKRKSQIEPRHQVVFVFRKLK